MAQRTHGARAQGKQAHDLQKFVRGERSNEIHKREVLTLALPEKWHPVRELERFRHELNDLLEHSGFEHHRPKNWESQPLRPALESFVNGDQLTVRVDLPGIDPESIDVRVVGGFLTIKGSREENQESKYAQYYRRETRYGVFERTLQLPEGVKAEDLKATHKNGVLELTATLPKQGASKQVKVEVQKQEGAKPAADGKR
jgi:HSP20 family protein